MNKYIVIELNDKDSDFSYCDADDQCPYKCMLGLAEFPKGMTFHFGPGLTMEDIQRKTFGINPNKE